MKHSLRLVLAFALALAPALVLAEAPKSGLGAGVRPIPPDAPPPGSGIDAGYETAPSETEAVGSWVIGKGMEPVITDMLGGKDELPGNCSLDSANVWRTYIRVRWACGGKDPITGVVEHPGAAQPGALVTTDKFSVRPVGDVPWPPGFADALKARLAAKGDKFVWMETHPNDPVPPGTFKSDPVPEGTYPDSTTKTGVITPGAVGATKRKVPVTVIVLAVLVFVGIGYQLWKRRQPQVAAAPEAETPVSTPEPAPTATAETASTEPPKDGGGGAAS